MARYDKYDGVAGGFRGALAADAASDGSQFDVVLGAGLDANGHVVLGDAGHSGFTGVTIVDKTKRKAGDVQDVMTNGEIVEVSGLTAGTTYYLDDDGKLTATAPAAGATGLKVGHTVEADRLVVRFGTVTTPAEA
jgi:hypothetical protein